MNPHIWWYVSRASGIVAWSLLAATMSWGIWLSVRRRGARVRPAWLLDLHRWMGGLAVGFTLVHLSGLLLDDFVGFRIIDVVVPLVSSWHPLAVAWGIVAFYLLLAVEGTSLAIHHLPRDRWRAIHLSSHALFWLASVHMLLAGTDSGSWPLGLLAATGMGTVGVGLVVRQRRTQTRESRPSTVAPPFADTWR